MRKLFVVASALSPFALLAEDAAPTIDLSAASTAASSIGVAVAGLLTGACLTAMLTVYGGRITLWVVSKLASWVGAGKK